MFKSAYTCRKSLIAFSFGLALPGIVLAHHGFGLYQVGTAVEYSGTITKIDFVNPHSYLYFERVDENGELLAMKCEMRAATLLRRSGWSREMFQPGLEVHIEGNPHRDDPRACYIENLTIGDQPTINRNDQFSIDNPIDITDRPQRLANGILNITGDWAVEQLVLTVPPEGGNGSMVPKSLREAFASGEITQAEISARNPPRNRPVYTSLGEEAASAFRMWSPEDNPRLSCRSTSIIYDWTFDWPVNRITQTTSEEGRDVIDIDYGLYAFHRRIYMDMNAHPANLTPAPLGHSIGHWEGDVLVVDTIGFQEGVLSPPTRNSEALHITERFILDTQNMTLTRQYTATDPVYLAEPWQGADVVLLSEVPFEQHPCEELTPEFSQ